MTFTEFTGDRLVKPSRNCCEELPALVVTFDGGIGMVMCLACASTVSLDRRCMLPDGWQDIAMEFYAVRWW